MKCDYRDIITRGLNNFIANTKGSIATLSAFGFTAAMVTVGSAVDYSRMVTDKNNAQILLDSAVLAASSALKAGKTKAEAVDSAYKVFNAQKHTLKYGTMQPTITPTISKGIYTVQGQGKFIMNTSMMKLVKIDSMDATIESEATFTAPRDEITLVLDVSWTMGNFDRLTKMKEAMSAFVDEMKPFKSNNSYRVISLIPFGESVNFPSIRKREDWLGPSTAEAPHSDFVGCYRPESNASLTSSAISPTEGPGHYKAFRSIVSSEVPTCPADTSSLFLFSPYANKLKPRIEALTLSFGTATDVGASWGWRSLSPNWRGVINNNRNFPSDFHPNNNKVMVILTDGRERRADIEGDGTIEPAEDGRLLGQTNLATICDNIRAEGKIKVYTVGYDVTDKDDLKERLRHCAVNGGRMIDANTQDIKAQLLEIASEITRVRLTN